MYRVNTSATLVRKPNLQMETSILLAGANDIRRREKLEKILAKFFPKSGKFNPNLVSISGQIGIDDVRNFKAKLAQKPYSGDVQVGLVEIEEITTEAQNALLKLVEEPSSHTQIIISVANSAKLLPTVISRCQKTFVSDATEPEILKTAVKDAQVAVFGDLGEKFNLAEKLSKNDAQGWVSQQISFWHKIFLVQLEVGVGDGELSKISKKVELEKTFQLLKSLLRTQTLLKLNINPRLLLENLFLSI